MITHLEDKLKAYDILSSVLSEEDAIIQQGKEVILSHFKEHMYEYEYLVSQDTELEGVLAYDAEKYHIYFLVVKKEYRHNDIGSSLLDALKQEAGNKNISKLTVNVFESDKSFYVSNGFEVCSSTDTSANIHVTEMEYLLGRNMLGKTVTVIVERHYGDYHPTLQDTRLPYNAGYVKQDITEEDALFQDAYIIGVEENIDVFTGYVCGIIYHKDEENSKWIVAPIGMNVDYDDVIQLLGLEEQFYDSRFIWSK